MLYELNEKKLFANEKSNKKSFAKNIFENESTIEKSKEKSTINSFIFQFDMSEIVFD